MAIDLLVEGYVDELVLRAALTRLNHQVGTVYGKRGVSFLKQRAEGIAVRGAHGHRVLIVADAMDLDALCPSEAARSLVSAPPSGTLVRVAVREMEAWLLASRAELARFLRISLARIPTHSDQVVDPKERLINLARQSSSSKLREMMVPRIGTSAQVGVGYVDAVSNFLNGYWDSDAAAEVSPSFRKFQLRLCEKFG